MNIIHKCLTHLLYVLYNLCHLYIYDVYGTFRNLATYRVYCDYRVYCVYRACRVSFFYPSFPFCVSPYRICVVLMTIQQTTLSADRQNVNVILQFVNSAASTLLKLFPWKNSETNFPCKWKR
jgi:uncharacterized membrane protein YhhN